MVVTRWLGLMLMGSLLVGLHTDSAAAALVEFRQKATASDGASSAEFGISLRGDATSLNKLIVGQLPAGGNTTGSAYVFREHFGNWSTGARKLTPTGGLPDDNFGRSVSIWREYAIVGAHGPAAGTDPGAAYVFYELSDWRQVAKLVASDGALGDDFGFSVDIDSNTAIIGAYRDDDHGEASGSAYIFRRSGAVWNQIAKLTASDARPGDHFGYSVAISGNTAVVGAAAKGPGDAGGAYIFRDDGLGNWTQSSVLTHSDPAPGDRFGTAVSIDRDVALVGAVGKDSQAGAAYVFREGGGGDWQQVSKLTAGDADPGDNFGLSVDIAGRAALVGGKFESEQGASAGAAYFFEENQAGDWLQSSKVTAFDAAAGDQFGSAVALVGKNAVVGSQFDDDLGPDSGSAYFYRLNINLKNNPDLLYDPVTGNVKIDADGANIISFNLQSADQFSGTANFADLNTDVLGYVSPLAENSVRQIGWISALGNAGLGFDGPAGAVNTPLADLGNIFPTGLDEEGLAALLTNNQWAYFGGGGQFELVVVHMPEPSSLVLLAVGGLGLFVLRSRAH